MNYAVVEDGVVTNVISLCYCQAFSFPNAVPMNDIPAIIGDQYLDGVFYRDGSALISDTDLLVSRLDNEILNLEYEALLTSLGLEV